MKESEKFVFEELSGDDQIFIMRTLNALARKNYGASMGKLSDDQLDFVIREAHHIGVFPEGTAICEAMKNDTNWCQN